MTPVFRLSTNADSELRAIYRGDPDSLREIWRIVRDIAADRLVQGIAAPFRRGAWRTVPAGGYRILYRPLSSHELRLGEVRGILVAKIGASDKVLDLGVAG